MTVHGTDEVYCWATSQPGGVTFRAMCMCGWGSESAPLLRELADHIEELIR